MIKVITIDREYGSGGSIIAERVAAQRGWTLWDQNLTCEIAKLGKCERSVVERREERNDSVYYRLMKSFFRGGFEGTLNAQPLLEVLDSDTLVTLTERVVRRAVSEGNCVIVGRGSAYFLQSIPEAFHVFIYSTKEDKVRRLRRQGKSLADATELIETVDHERAAFIKRYHGKCWPDRYLFNLMVNGAGGEDAAAQLINEAVAIHEAHHLDKAVLTETGTQCA
jgi:Cytidylate kinase-like family